MVEEGIDGQVEGGGLMKDYSTFILGREGLRQKSVSVPCWGQTGRGKR
jgi:hypothetical protein